MATARRRHTVRHAVALLAAAGAALAACSGGTPGQAPSGRVHPFDSYRVQGREVVVSFTGIPDQPGPCGADYRAGASETVDRVYIRLRELPHAGPQGDAACPALAQLRTVTVTLAAPVGSRAVVDGATGDIVPQPPPTPTSSP